MLLYRKELQSESDIRRGILNEPTFVPKKMVQVDIEVPPI